jgi:serine/threonine-protein kinase
MDAGGTSRGAPDPRRSEPSSLIEAEALFHRALEMPEDRRIDWLETHCDDSVLRGFVLELLAHHLEDDDLIDVAAAAAGESEARIATGTRIGRYRIVGELGRGGMGIVYEAERADLGKRVALKLARERFPTPDGVRRFELEQRVLARLQHPNIAQLHDAGVTEAGTPYFAMEIVAGDEIVRHVRAAGLDTVRRLELFLAVCSAVQAAHRNLVVHRDIKPSNVLVTGDGRVKLLDFGVAKLLEESEAAGLTGTGKRVYTPGYAAPEQLRGEPVTTATDVYQLGALLYELLAGCPAFDVTGLSAFEAERRVLETDPPAPSRNRALHGPGDRGISRDLDSIALKALQKEPERRYASVDAFAADVRRYLEGLPVQARPNTVTYRVRRFARRHRFGVASAAAFVLLLAGSVVVLAQQRAVTAAERDRAQSAAQEAGREAAKARQVTDFLVGLFEGSDPSVARGDTLTAREIMDRGVTRIDALADQPQVRATLLGTTGRIHFNLGNVEEADSLLRRALATWATVPEPDQRALADARLQLGQALDLRARHEESAELYRTVSASAAARESPDIRSRSLYGLFTSLHALGEESAADSALTEWEASLRSAPAALDPFSVREMIRLGQTFTYSGEIERARQLLRQGIAQSRLLYGDRHPEVVQALIALTVALSGSPPDAERDSVTADALELSRMLHPEGHPQLSSALEGRALFLRERNRLEEAEALLREALAMEPSSEGSEGLRYMTRYRNLAMLLAARGELDDAEARLRETLAWWRRNFGPDYLFALAVEMDLGEVLSRAKRFEEGAAVLRSVHRRLTEARGNDDRYTQRAVRLLAELHDAWGRGLEAEAYRSRLSEQ